jgi:CrcB protein
MTPGIFLLLALAGGVGATVRFIVDGAIRARQTTIINVSGSLVLGFLTGLTIEHFVSTDFSIVIGTGFLGGYTTFSTASYETVQLIKKGRYGASFISGIVMLVLSVAAAVIGLWAGAEI